MNMVTENHAKGDATQIDIQCRVCRGPVSKIFYSAPRSVLGITRPVDESLSVYLCERCGHGQSDDIDFDRYYSKEYRFELQSAEHDQLHSVVNGNKIYRTDLQVDAVFAAMNLPQGARVLDYGAAKASTLKKICHRRPDIVPSVFDVSADYAPLWSEWIPKERQSTFNAPKEWSHSFDAVLSFFVLEHVEKPNLIIKELKRLLRPDGRLFIVVPNPLTNVSDFVVLEHVNHYTISSLVHLLDQNGLSIDSYSGELFTGAHVIVASGHKRLNSKLAETINEVSAMRSAADFLDRAQAKIISKAKEDTGRPSAIYGAGVYGSYIATRIEKHANLKAFVDRNPQLWGMSEFGIPVVGPEELPKDVNLIYAGVNPLRAREWLTNVSEWRNRQIEVEFLD